MTSWYLRWYPTGHRFGHTFVSILILLLMSVACFFQSYVNYGLEHWGSDDRGVENTRRVVLNVYGTLGSLWYSICRYSVGTSTVPVVINIFKRSMQLFRRPESSILLNKSMASFVFWIDLIISGFLISGVIDWFLWLDRWIGSWLVGVTGTDWFVRLDR